MTQKTTARITPRIALVDDDRNIVTSVALALEAEGFEVLAFHDGEEGYEGIIANNPDLVVLDVKMPRMDGMELLSKLREKSNVPAIFLTSKDDEVDQVLGLRLGADDYITKPFSQRLLIERIRTVLRRNSKSIESSASESNKITRGFMVLDETRHICKWKDCDVNLTVTEYLMVKSLVLNPGHVKSRDQLINDSYGANIYVDDRTVDTHIKRIRKKFRDCDDNFDAIETLYGVGYRYKEP